MRDRNSPILYLEPKWLRCPTRVHRRSTDAVGNLSWVLLAATPRRRDAAMPRRHDAATPRRRDAATPRRRDAATPRPRDPAIPQSLYARLCFHSGLALPAVAAMRVFADDHNVSNAPDLFRPPKLSGTGPSQDGAIPNWPQPQLILRLGLKL